MTKQVLIQCCRCPDGEKTQVLIKGDPKSVAMCHCGECRNRCCGLGGAHAVFGRDQVEIQNLNAKWTDCGTHVMCKCLDVVFLHAADYTSDAELKVNAGMICNGLCGDDLPTSHNSKKENDPFFYGDFLTKENLVHVNYEKRIFDWDASLADSSKEKIPLPEEAQKAIEDKVIPASCWCGKARATLSGDNVASTFCLCSKCRSRSSTMDSSVEIPSPCVEFTTPDEMEIGPFGSNDTNTVYGCKTCGTVMDLRLDDMQISVFNTSSIVQGLIGADANPADYDWGGSGAGLHAPASLVGGNMCMFYSNRAINLYNDMPKWVDFPGPFGGQGGLMDNDGELLPAAEEEETPAEDKASE